VRRSSAKAKVAAALVYGLPVGSPTRRRAAYASLSRLYVAELSTPIATRRNFESKERQSGLDAVGDSQGGLLLALTKECQLTCSH
jgi:hypothetical protein